MCLCLISKSNRGYFPKRCPGNNRYPALVAVTVLRTFVVRAALPITLKPLGEPNWTAQVRSRETPFESPKAPWRPLHRRLPERVECRRLDSVSFNDNWHSDDYMATHSTGRTPPQPPQHVTVRIEGSSRSIRKELVRAAQQGAPELIIETVGDPPHPHLAELLQDTGRLKSERIVLRAPTTHLESLGEQRRIALRRITTIEESSER